VATEVVQAWQSRSQNEPEEKAAEERGTTVSNFAYVDEAGDTGFKFNRGSSEYFVVAMVMVDDPLPLQSAIDDLRHELGLPRRVEFSFNKSSPTHRRRFLEVVRGHEVAVRGWVANKVLTTDQPHLAQTGDLYDHFTHLALVQYKDTFDDTIVVLDERVKSKREQRAINARLRQALNTEEAPRRVRDFKHLPSLGNNLIQAADMVAGAIYFSYARADDRYLNLIRAKVRDIHLWDGVVSPET
jgi:hypothetical protein